MDHDLEPDEDPSPPDTAAPDGVEPSRLLIGIRALALLVVWLLVGAALLVVLWLLTSIVISLVGSL